jgi:hypothetical protein
MIKVKRLKHKAEKQSGDPAEHLVAPSLGGWGVKDQG